MPEVVPPLKKNDVVLLSGLVVAVRGDALTVRLDDGFGHAEVVVHRAHVAPIKA